MEYERKVLIPYLTELYGIEVTYQTLIHKYNDYKNIVVADEANIRKKDKLDISLSKPLEPRNKSRFYMNVIGGLCVVVFLVFLFTSGLLMASIGTGVFFVGFGSMGGRVSERYKEEMDEYNRKLRRYNGEFQELEEEKSRIRQSMEKYSTHKAVREEIENELSTCVKVREDAYALNIIPNQYRNYGSIVYLYEYFTTSQTSNLDQVIQTMILDDVSNRIKNIEAGLGQLITNQRQIFEKLSNIQSTAANILFQTKQMSNQLDNIENINHEQLKQMQLNSYELKMIRNNTNIANYLALGTYLKVTQY